MNVLLVRPPDPMQGSALLSHTRSMNLAYLAAWLRREGVVVTLADYEVERFDPESYVERLHRLSPALIGFSAATPTVTGAARLAELAKTTLPHCITVIGGAHANGLPLGTMEEFAAFDCLAYGEGEQTLLELCRVVERGGSLAGITGLVHRDGGRVVINPPRALLAELDDLPLPARDLFVTAAQAGHTSRGFSNRLCSAELFTARGCPFACSFCAIQATFGRSVRFHSVARVGREIDHLAREHGCNHLVIADDTFTLLPERAAEICGHLKGSGIASWNCDTRASTVTPQLLRAMAQSGCGKVAFGVEAGSQRIMDRIGKELTVEQVTRAVRWAKEAGIPHIEGNFIIGADPGETVADLEQTRRLILTLPWTFVSVAVIVPYPGTPVYEQMRETGQIEADAAWDDFVMFGRTPRWRTDHFSASQLVAWQKQLTRAFYLRPGYIAGRLAGIRSWDEARYWFGAGAAYLRWY
ncbi:MAG: B12-binding domain-containing radical SAM protein, partial [Gemmatimonadales bacterium]